MDYDINELLFKLGINELCESKNLRWHYMDGRDPDISGFADARLEDDDRILTVELSHSRKNVEDDDGTLIKNSLETVQLSARRIGDSELFRITKIAFDGDEYDADNRAMLELCCGIFYARALEISEIMTKQRFNSLEVAEAHKDAEERLKMRQERRRKTAKQVFDAPNALMGVVVPFKPREDAPLQRI